MFCCVGLLVMIRLYLLNFMIILSCGCMDWWCGCCVILVIVKKLFRRFILRCGGMCWSLILLKVLCWFGFWLWFIGVLLIEFVVSKLVISGKCVMVWLMLILWVMLLLIWWLLVMSGVGWLSVLRCWLICSGSVLNWFIMVGWCMLKFCGG